MIFLTKNLFYTGYSAGNKSLQSANFRKVFKSTDSDDIKIVRRLGLASQVAEAIRSPNNNTKIVRRLGLTLASQVAEAIRSPNNNTSVCIER